MAIVVIGGTGFIGRRLIPLFVERGEEGVCMNINPAAASFDGPVKASGTRRTESRAR